MAAFPSTPVASSARVRSIQPTLISTSQNMKRQARTRGAQRWAATLSWAVMTRAIFMPVWAFVVALRGQYGTFTIVLPGHDTPQGSWAGGAPLVDGASQVGRSVNIKGLTAGQTGIAKAGDFIKFADTKVYMVTADANSDGAGKATITIEPALIVSPADSEAIVYTSVPFTMCLTGDTNEYPVQPPLLFTFDLGMVEAY